jgi:hypothetical protein
LFTTAEHLKQGNDQTPGVGAMNHKPLHQDARNLFTHAFLLGKSADTVEDVQDQAVEVVRVAAGVAKVVRRSAQEEMAS